MCSIHNMHTPTMTTTTSDTHASDSHFVYAKCETCQVNSERTQTTTTTTVRNEKLNSKLLDIDLIGSMPLKLTVAIAFAIECCSFQQSHSILIESIVE